jgi:hypothetical protein
MFALQSGQPFEYTVPATPVDVEFSLGGSPASVVVVNKTTGAIGIYASTMDDGTLFLKPDDTTLAASAYNVLTAYVVGDLVSAAGVIYRAVDASTGESVTDTDFWEVIPQGIATKGITPVQDSEDPTKPQGFVLGQTALLNEKAGDVLMVTAFQASAAYNRAAAR